MKKIFFILFILPAHLYAHDEEHGKETKQEAALTYFSSENNSDKYEVLIKYPEIEPGKETVLQLFISNYVTNEPVDSAKLAIISSENDLKFDAVRIDKGIYQISAKFPEQKSYALNITINAKLGADLIQIKDIKVGEKLPVAEATHSDVSFFKSKGIWIGAGLLGGIILTLIITRKRKINPTATILLCITLMIPASIETISAHEGHEDTSKENNFSGNYVVLKETQFLFNIYTQKIKAGDFTETINLFGTVIPASNGRATVQSPQSGKINTVNVRVGQTVSQGDILAILEQSIDASSQVDLLTQKNALDAELVAAKKEYDRLQTIKDIVSKKELDEADARFNTALENKKVFDNLNAGNASNSKLIYLKSPINGVVDYFNLSSGASVNANETIFTINNISKVYIEAQVYDENAAKIKSATKFVAECSDDTHANSEVKLISLPLTINATNQSQKILFELDNKSNEFKLGEFVTVRVFTDNLIRNIAVPNSSIMEMNGKPVVFIKDAAEKYSINYISAGENNGDYTVIEKGVEEDERVVTNGSYQMKMIYVNQ